MADVLCIARLLEGQAQGTQIPDMETRGPGSAIDNAFANRFKGLMGTCMRGGSLLSRRRHCCLFSDCALGIEANQMA